MLARSFLVLATLLAALNVSAAARRAKVPVEWARPGFIVIMEKERALYFVLNKGAIRYPVAVPKKGMQWSGGAMVTEMHRRPAWRAPDVVRRDHPELTGVIPGGAPNNPMGEAALVLSVPEIAIHGTAAHMRGSIGSAASYGCIRMYNEDVLDLYARVRVGTPVYMIR